MILARYIRVQVLLSLVGRLGSVTSGWLVGGHRRVERKKLVIYICFYTDSRKRQRKRSL